MLSLKATGALPTVWISTDRIEFGENEEIGARVTVVRQGSTNRSLRVNVSHSGTARFEKHYRGMPTEVHFAPGESEVTFTVSPIDDLEPGPAKSLKLSVTPFMAPFSIAILPDTQFYSLPGHGGVPEMFTSQTRWIVENESEWNIAFTLHEGDCTENNSRFEWERVKASMSVLDGAVPYAIAVGNHDGLTSARTQTELFNEYFPLTNYEHQATFGSAFESNRMDNVCHLFSAGGIDWLVLTLEFGPRDEVLEWANSIVARHANRKVIIVTHSHIYSDSSLHGSDPSHLWTPKEYGRWNDGVAVWEKLVRKHGNIAFVFNGHVLNSGQGRLVGIGDHGNSVYQMLCNYQIAPNGGSGYMRVIKFYPAEDRFEAHSFSPYTGVHLTQPWNSFGYTNIGLFGSSSNAYDVDAVLQSITLTISNNDVDRQPPAITSISAHGNPAEILVKFNESLDPQSASSITNYAIPGLSLSSVHLLSDGATVAIRVATPMKAGQQYFLIITGVCDGSAERNPMSADEPFTHTPALLVDDFADAESAGWMIVDQGTIDGPSVWICEAGLLFQASNIHGPNANALDLRKGTFNVWNTPAALTWSNYTFVTRLRSFYDDGIGVLFRYVNPSNYLKFEMDAKRAFRKLTKTIDGVETTLSSNTNSGYPLANWHVLLVEVDGPTIRVSLNGQPALPEINDESLPRGTIALYAWRNFAAHFDWARVFPIYSRPTAKMTSPMQGDAFLRNTNVTVEIEVDDPEGWLDYVELLDRGRIIHTFHGPPYSLTLTNVTTQEHVFTLRVVDQFGNSRDSSPVSWFVLDPVPPPSLVLQPGSQIVAEGGTAYFLGRADSSTRVKYQWRFNGAPFANATNTVLLIEGVTEQDEGAYTLTAINISGETNSAPAFLTVIQPPATNSPPIDFRCAMRVEALMDNGRALFSVSGPPDSTLVVETSADLQEWARFKVLTNASDRSFFTDSRTNGHRFYRINGVE